MVWPECIIVGFPKCGTSSLKHDLHRHSKIHSYQDGEANFFSGDMNNQEEYVDSFPSGKLGVEKTPVYIFEESSMKNIYNKIPNAKIIICIRHPIQRLHSYYSHWVRRYYSHNDGIDPTKTPFHDIVLNNLKINEVSNESGAYIKYIKNNVLKYFDKSKVHIVIQEKMLQSPEETMNKIFQFLEVEKEEIEFKKLQVHNQNNKYSEIDYSHEKYSEAIKYLHNYYQEYNEELFEFLGYRIEEWDTVDEQYKGSY
jgi:hypothetical protein